MLGPEPEPSSRSRDDPKYVLKKGFRAGADAQTMPVYASIVAKRLPYNPRSDNVPQKVISKKDKVAGRRIVFPFYT